MLFVYMFIIGNFIKLFFCQKENPIIYFVSTFFFCNAIGYIIGRYIFRTIKTDYISIIKYLRQFAIFFIIGGLLSIYISLIANDKPTLSVDSIVSFIILFSGLLCQAGADILEIIFKAINEKKQDIIKDNDHKSV